MPLLVLLFLEYAGDFLRLQAFGDEVVVFAVVLLRPFGEDLYLCVLFLLVADSDHS